MITGWNAAYKSSSEIEMKNLMYKMYKWTRLWTKSVSKSVRELELYLTEMIVCKQIRI